MFRDLGYVHTTAFDGGFLIPVGIDEVLPGDFWRGDTQIFLRASPLARPLLSSVQIDVRSFFVPNRLLWPEWEAFRNQEVVGAFPTITMAANQPLIDYLGANSRNGEVISALPIRAYNLVVNKKFYGGLPAFVMAERNLDDVTLARALWPRDYFTGARTQPQLGPQEQIPITISAGVVGVDGIGVAGAPTRGTVTGNARQRSPLPDFAVPLDAGGASLVGFSGQASGGTLGNTGYIRTTGTGTGMRPNVTVDLTNLASATGVSLADLRRAVQSQKWKELRQKIGPDYVDLIRAMGASSSDLRLREPEYLGGGRRRVAFSEVLATAQSASVDVGEMFGHGIATLGHRPWSYYASEDGFVVTLASVRPGGVYAQAIPRMFSRVTEADFWSPQRQMIGDQAILNKEVYSAHSAPNGIFGYQDRFYDYMRSFDMVSGTMRNVAEMQWWHLARIFSSDVALNQSFLECNFPNRVFLDQTQRNFVSSIVNRRTARRLVKTGKVL